jgi:ADP-ribose pyrophosphatase
VLNYNIVFSGKLFEIVQKVQKDGRMFEIARRPPGVRLIISDKVNKRILLTREYRHELQDYDYRLPGGKVFDSLNELHAWEDSGQDILDAAKAKAIGEGAEEAGVDISELELFQVSTLGATVEWDLYVFDVTNWQPHELGQQLEQGEDIEADTWFSFEEAEQMIYDGKIQEDRVALILLKWLHSQKQSR